MAEAGAFHFDQAADLPTGLVMDAVRCWRAARDDGNPVQPCLYANLSLYRCEMLAPVFDSLMVLGEWALERCIVAGKGSRPSTDEFFLLEMLVAPDLARHRLTCAREVAAVFRCALYSTRIMMKMTAAETVGDEKSPALRTFSQFSDIETTLDNEIVN